MSFLNRKLTESFHSLGLSVAKYPKSFILTTLILCMALGTGLLQIQVDTDIYTLYVDRNAESKQEYALAKALFPGNETNRFTPSRKMHAGRFAR